MPWISLSATRYDFYRILAEKMAQPDYKDSKMKVVTANDGRNALLTGEEQFIEVELKRAQELFDKMRSEWKPPPEAAMSKVLGLAIIVSLSGADVSDVLEAIAKTKSYKHAWEKSLQLIAQRIVGIEESPRSSDKEPGHIAKDSRWYHLVKRMPTEHSFNLSVTPDHPRWPLLGSYVLPLAYLLNQERQAKDHHANLLRLLRYGGAHPERSGTILYERRTPRPDLEMKVKEQERETWRGFDAVEIKEGQLRAYYYLGMRWKAPLLFQKEINTFDFLDNIALDWRMVEETLSTSEWAEIEQAIKNDRCTYVIVYDAHDSFAPPQAIEKAAEHYRVNLEALDLTEV